MPPKCLLPSTQLSWRHSHLAGGRVATPMPLISRDGHLASSHRWNDMNRDCGLPLGRSVNTEFTIFPQVISLPHTGCQGRRGPQGGTTGRKGSGELYEEGRCCPEDLTLLTDTASSKGPEDGIPALSGKPCGALNDKVITLKHT